MTEVRASGEESGLKKKLYNFLPLVLRTELLEQCAELARRTGQPLRTRALNDKALVRFPLPRTPVETL